MKKDLVNLTLKAENIKEKIDTCDHIKNENLCISKSKHHKDN